MIKSKNIIRQLSEPPTHKYVKSNGLTEFISMPFSFEQKRIHANTIARDTLFSCTVVDSAAREDKELFDPLIPNIREIAPGIKHNHLPLVELYDDEDCNGCEYTVHLKDFRAADESIVHVLQPNQIYRGHTIQYFNLPIDLMMGYRPYDVLVENNLSVQLIVPEPNTSGPCLIRITNMGTEPYILVGEDIIAQVHFQEIEL